MAMDWRPSCRIDTLPVRAAMLCTAREFFASRNVLEVQTPVLAQGTVTDAAIDSIRVGETGRYLQTSPEYHMKRLLAAGAPSIYQIGPVFREGEEGRWHNPEFTMIEWYRLGFDTTRLMAEVADLVDALIGSAAYDRIAYADLLGQRFGADIAGADSKTLVNLARDLGTGDEIGVEQALDLLLADAIGSQRGKRVFVTDFPAALAALAKVDANGLAARFELVVDGIEIANGYHELQDPGELAARMAGDARRRRDRSRPVVEADQRLLAAQRHGLPDSAGVAVGFDRLLALRLEAASIAETMAFDWQRA